MEMKQEGRYQRQDRKKKDRNRVRLCFLGNLSALVMSAGAMMVFILKELIAPPLGMIFLVGWAAHFGRRLGALEALDSE